MDDTQVIQEGVDESVVLRRRITELEQLLGVQAAVVQEWTQRYKAEQTARVAAETALARSIQWVALAVHELRTLLTVLFGHAQMLERAMEGSDEISQQNRDSVATIASYGTRLAILVDRLLDTTHPQHRHLELVREPVDVVAMAWSVVEAIRPTLTGHTVSYAGRTEPLIVDGDRLRLEEMLHNLLENAVKYSPHGGPIIVRVVQEQIIAQISVRDQGIGIPAEAREKLFERFYRADNTDDLQIDGLGVGLYIVHQIVTLHGGTIKVDSQEGIGSTFMVGLPISVPAMASQEEG